MEDFKLSTRDINVLQKIKDPESDPSAGISIDPSLPSDPNIVDLPTYQRISQREQFIILEVQQGDRQVASLESHPSLDPVAVYKEALESMDRLIDEHPRYASARNNRAQILRRLYGDSILLADARPEPQVLLREVHPDEKRRAATKLLVDLDECISLVSPIGRQALSPQAARTLSLAYTQRAAIYFKTAKLLDLAALSVPHGRREAGWNKLGFEEAASRDFAMGGRYGNDIAKGLAVSTNPTAKLCGQIVREAMKKEYGTAFTA